MQHLENQSPLTFEIMQNNQQAPKGFHRLSIEERLDQIVSMTELGQDEIQCLKKFGKLPEETANGMVENVIGVMGIPFAVSSGRFPNFFRHWISSCPSSVIDAI